MARVVVLTGGIGSGKSTASAVFRKLGIEVIDTDEISHALTAKNGAAIGGIATIFGKEYVPEGSLDRPKMRRLVFSDDSSRKKLEALLHPMIREEVGKRVARAQSPYCLIVVPLLFETEGYRSLANRILVIDCSEAKQIERAMKRSALTEEAVRIIMQKQVSRPTRLAGADDVVENEGSVEDLEARIRQLHEKYLAEYLKNAS